MKIMVIDNHILFREGVASLLRKQRDIEIVGESDVSHHAVEKALGWEPDIILLDPGSPYEDAVNVMKRILFHRPQVSFVIFITHHTDEQFFELIRIGVRGYLPKHVSKPMLLAALHALDRGEAVIPRGLVTKLLSEFARLGKIAEKNARDKDMSLLTYREMEVLKILRTRATNREIAEQLIISENTVRVHVRNILGKLDFRNRREASYFAKRVDLFEGGSAADSVMDSRY